MEDLNDTMPINERERLSDMEGSSSSSALSSRPPSRAAAVKAAAQVVRFDEPRQRETRPGEGRLAEAGIIVGGRAISLTDSHRMGPPNNSLLMRKRTLAEAGSTSDASGPSIPSSSSNAPSPTSTPSAKVVAIQEQILKIQQDLSRGEDVPSSMSRACKTVVLERLRAMAQNRPSIFGNYIPPVSSLPNTNVPFKTHRLRADGRDKKESSFLFSSRMLVHEARSLVECPIEGLTVGPRHDNIRVWTAIVEGSVNTPYEGGVFFFDIFVPVTYPATMPKIVCLTRIRHPWVNEDGNVSLTELRGKGGKNEMTMRELVTGLIYMFNLAIIQCPSTDETRKDDLAAHRFCSQATVFTKRYAT